MESPKPAQTRTKSDFPFRKRRFVECAQCVFLLHFRWQIFKPSSFLSMQLVKWASHRQEFVHTRLYCNIVDRLKDPRHFYPDDIDAEPMDRRNFELCCLYMQLAPCNPCKSETIKYSQTFKNWLLSETTLYWESIAFSMQVSQMIDLSSGFK